uniref:Uncharacterized protein n=1 Tax=Lepeophtheirus salmonis TaxID=72036 RepID=A0A0K2UV99_LEPSM
MVWSSQVELPKGLLELEERARVKPLFLDGRVFSVYDQLTKEDKKQEGEIIQALRKAFSMSLFEACKTLKAKKWRLRESVNVRLAEIKTLISLMGVSDSSGLIHPELMSMMPEDVNSRMRATPGVDE